MERVSSRTFSVWATFVIACGFGFAFAQSSSAPEVASSGQQAVKVILKHFMINPQGSDPNTHLPLRADGSWSIAKERPETCPHEARTCVEVFYAVPEQRAKCSWTLAMDESGADGTVLNENDDAERYLLRELSASETVGLVNSRSKPVFPPIARGLRVGGPVTIRVIVGKSGEVLLAKPVSGPGMLVQSSLDAARKWRFSPLKIGDRSVEFEVQLVFTFDAALDLVKVKP